LIYKIITSINILLSIFNPFYFFHLILGRLKDSTWSIHI